MGFSSLNTSKLQGGGSRWVQGSAKSIGIGLIGHRNYIMPSSFLLQGNLGAPTRLVKIFNISKQSHRYPKLNGCKTEVVQSFWGCLVLRARCRTPRLNCTTGQTICYLTSAQHCVIKCCNLSVTVTVLRNSEIIGICMGNNPVDHKCTKLLIKSYFELTCVVFWSLLVFLWCFRRSSGCLRLFMIATPTAHKKPQTAARTPETPQEHKKRQKDNIGEFKGGLYQHFRTFMINRNISHTNPYNLAVTQRLP